MMKKKKAGRVLLSFLLSLAMVIGFMPGMGMTAHAEDPTEELLTTITATGKEQASYSTENVATVSFSYTANGSSSYLNNGKTNWGWWGYGWTATVTPADGYTITKCVFYDDANRQATDSEAPFVVETTEEDKTPRINGTPIDGGNYQSKGIKKIEVYGYATPAPALDPVSYMAWNGTTLVEKTGDDACTDYTVVTADTTTFEDGKWYVMSNSVTVSSRITVTGTVNLILCDGATLTASKGITVNSGNTINIYAQIGGTGELNAGSDLNVASIGGGARYQSSGTVNIHGGKITATGGSSASGIGGALDGGNGEVNIYGGNVTARGKNYAAGIGGYSGKSGGTVNIYGGTVNASGSQSGTTGIGIGGTNPGNCVVHIYGGEVTATSEKVAAGIQGTVTIDGGTVTANGGVSDGIDDSSGETYSSNGINGTITVNGGTVTASGGNVTANSYMGAIQSYGGTIYACSGISGTVTISGGTVTATGGNVTGDINNYGGTIYACNGVNGTVTISGGTVTATGGSHTGNSSGTTVKEKGFGGSLTLGTGMYLYGGTSANPESNQSNYRAGAGDYTGDRYVYMTVNNVVPHTHSFNYTATGATITAACTAGCDITEGLALTISAPMELTYDGSAKAATLSTGYNTTAFPGEYMIKYYKGANEVEAANVKAAGDYTAKVTVGEATASVDFTIAKATPSIETIPTASAVTYGQKLADSTLTGGTGSVAGGFAWKDSTVAPAVSDSQNTEYDVVFTPTDENYDAAECKVKLTVNKADSAVTTAPTAKTLTYNGSAQSLINAGTASGGTMKYAVTTANQEPAAEAYTFDNTSLPTSTNAGTYYVWYKAKGDENHNDSEPEVVEVTIANPTYKVTYKVVNGTWSDGKTNDITETVERGSKPASVPTGMIAASGYTDGAWDKNPAAATIEGATTFTYSFTEIPRYTVTYKVVNGTWSDGKTVDITENVQSGSKPASVPSGMKASEGFTGGAWDKNPAEATIDGATTFTYSFTEIPRYTVTYKVVNGTWSDGKTVDITETVQSGSKPASVPTGMIASEGFTGGAWDKNPAETTITGATTFTYIFTEIPTYAVTYKVVNGTWSDDSITDKTETVQSGSKPVKVPTGMIASEGFTGGAWDKNPAETTITGATTFTYTFTEIPTYAVTYKVVNGTWSDGKTVDITETVQSGSKPASVPTGMKAASGFTGGAWDKNPAETTITGATTFTYTFTAKTPAVVKTAPTANTLAYTGSALELVTAGTAEGGEMQYAIGTNDSTMPADNLFTTSIPAKTDAGTYYVWYKVVGDSNHLDSDAGYVTVTIAPADSSDSGSGSSSSGSTDSGSDSSSSSGSSDSGNTSGGTSSGSSDNTNTNTDTSEKVPYDDVPISTGSVNDITGTVSATAESNPFGTKIENNSNLTTLLSLTDAEVAQGVNVWLDIQDMSASVPQTDKTLIQNTSGDYTVGLYLDINLFKKVGSNDATKVTETNGKVKASIVIPESLWKSGRIFEIIRVHDGVATAIAGTYDENTHIFTFETDKFSTYALAYKDPASSSDSGTTSNSSSSNSSNSTQSTAPKTGDPNDIRVWYLLLIASLGGLGFFGYSKKKKVND